MTQLYTEILETETLTNSRALLLNNDKTVMSCSSGTAFPTVNLQVGMLCLRTDQNKLYQLKDATPTWTLIGDLLMDYNTVVQAKGNLPTTSGDWNTYVTAGVYQVGGANWTGSTNGPNTAKATLYSFGQLIVTVFGSVVMQTYVAHSASQTGGIYFRLKYNATDWIPWSIQWNSTNDGAGSGLDADLLDGENLVDNAPTANTVVGRDVNGDIFVATLRGANINITGSAVLGDAVTDTHTINGSPTITGDVFLQNNKEIRWDANTDFAEIMYISVSDNDSRLRIAVGDNGNEQIEIGQYNGATFTARATLQANGSFNFSNVIQRAGNTVWDSGNDGVGSGLDADLLDGKGGDAYVQGDNASRVSNVTNLNTANPAGFFSTGDASSAVSAPYPKAYNYINHRYFDLGVNQLYQSQFAASLFLSQSNGHPGLVSHQDKIGEFALFHRMVENDVSSKWRRIPKKRKFQTLGEGRWPESVDYTLNQVVATLGDDGKLYLWGRIRNRFHLSKYFDNTLEHVKPFAFEGEMRWTQIAMDHRQCILGVNDSGNVYAIGGAVDNGQLGTAGPNAQDVTGGPFLVLTLNTNPANVILKMTVNYSSRKGSAVVNRATGRLYYSGSNTHGQAGQNNTAVQTAFIEIPQIAAQPWHDVWCDGLLTYAITNAATGYKLYATGFNGEGVLGVGDVTQRNVMTACIKQDGTQLTNVKWFRTIKHVDAPVSGYALTYDGILYTVGYNGYGNLGTGNTTNQSRWQQVLTGVAKVVLCCDSARMAVMCLMTDGSLRAFGDNGYGQLATGNTTNQSAPVTPLNSGPGTHVQIWGPGSSYGTNAFVVKNANGLCYGAGRGIYNHNLVISDGAIGGNTASSVWRRINNYNGFGGADIYDVQEVCWSSFNSGGNMYTTTYVLPEDGDWLGTGYGGSNCLPGFDNQQDYMPGLMRLELPYYQ